MQGLTKINKNSKTDINIQKTTKFIKTKPRET